MAAFTRSRHSSRTRRNPDASRLPNVGDIGAQTVAGAISTGIARDRVAQARLASCIAAATIVTGTGQILRVGDDSPGFPAEQLGLGALGNLVDVTLRCVDAFTLRADERPMEWVYIGSSAASYPQPHRQARRRHRRSGTLPGVDDVLERQCGVISRAQALSFLSEKAVRDRLATGRWLEPHRAVFVTHNGPLGTGERRWIALLAADDGAALAGLTALQVGGLRGYADESVHILIPAFRNVQCSPVGVVLHRTSVLPASDLVPNRHLARTRPARSVVDAAQWAHSPDAARAVVAASFQQRLVIATEVEEVLTRLSRARRRRLILETVRDAAGGSQSLSEIDFVRLCRRHRIPEPARQRVRRDGTGRRRYLDALFEPWGVHVEVDGAQHLDPRHAWDDMRRQNELWISGERVLRFPAWLVRRDSIAVISQIRAALFAAGWRP